MSASEPRDGPTGATGGPAFTPDAPARAPLRMRAKLGWSVAVGCAGGLLGFAYLGLLHVLEHALSPAHHMPWTQLGILVAAGAAVGLIGRWLGRPDDVELIVDDIHVLGGRSRPRRLRSLLPISLLCISSGGAAGPEAPLVQTTGTLAQYLAERLRLANDDRRHLTIAGMAAAFTVLFGAPLGAALFALEILHRRGLQYYEALLPALVSSLVGYAVYVMASGLGLTPVWTFDDVPPASVVDLGWAVGAGALGAAIAILFTNSVLLARRALRVVPEGLRPLAGGLVLGLLGVASPWALTYGKFQIDPMLAAEGSIAFFALAAAAKLVGTSVTLSAGWRGGFIIPLFFIGAATARALHLAFPETNEALLAGALMASINTGVTKTPLGSTLVVCKMAGLSLIPSTAAAATLAFVLTHRSGLIETQRERTLGEPAPPEQAVADTDRPPPAP